MNGRYYWLVRFACFLCGCIFTVQVNAAFPAPYIKTKYGYTKKVNPSQFRTEYLIETGNMPAGSTIPRNKSLVVYTPKSTVVDRAKKFKRVSPFDAAVVAAVAAAGWAIDELTGQITKPVQTESPGSEYDPAYGWSVGESWGLHSTATDACLSRPPPDGIIHKEVEPYRDGKSWCVGEDTESGSKVNWVLATRFPVSIPIPPTDPVFDIEWKPVSDSEEEDIIDKAVSTSSSRQLKPIFSDPYNNPYNWPDFWDRLRDWMRDVANDDPVVSWDPANDRWVYPSPSNPASDLNIEPDPIPDPSAPDFDPTESAGPSEGQVELPDFCKWATVVCEWLEWTKEEPEDMRPDDLPVEELTADSFRRDYNAGLGSGSCPADVTFSLQGQTGTFSYANACMAARNYFRPVLLTIAGITAAFIIVGASRRAV